MEWYPIQLLDQNLVVDQSPEIMSDSLDDFDARDRHAQLRRRPKLTDAM